MNDTIMNTKFNPGRLLLLLKRFFVENAQRELNYWLIVTAVFALIFNQTDSVRFFLYISGLFFAARQFKFFAYTPGGMHYLLIPATHVEKFSSALLITIPYYFLMVVLTYFLGTTVGVTVSNLFFNTDFTYHYEFITQVNSMSMFGPVMSQFTKVSLLNTFCTFAFIQSLFLMGSLFFKRNAAVKTMLSVIILGFLLLMFQLLLFKILYGSFSFDSSRLVLNNFNPDASAFVNISTIVYKTLSWVTVPFFWIVSYFRLTEKQV